MEPEASETNYRPSTFDRVLSVAGPVFYVAISYLDPGKWATAVEGGARLGSDLVFLVLAINLVAILCQYLSARVAIITGKNLTEICIEEYDDTTCLILGIQAQISMVAADLTMVIGTAYGLHTVFGIDLFSCVFFTGFDAILFPFVVILLDNSKAKLLSLFLVWFLLVTYVCGILTSQPESSLSMGGMLSKLSGENMYALMGVLGANIMPHNLYLHSSLVQDLGQTNLFVGALCQDHFFATLCIFSGIFLLNTVLINSAANLFYSSGLVSLTLQDAMSLLDQIFRSSTASFALILIMFFSNQLVPLSWFLGKQVTSQGFFRLEIPSWLHRVTIRLIAIIPALYCVWSSGTEGLFQMLIFTQVLVAFLLPSSVIPLFRISSSRSVMGAYKISHVVEFLAILSVVGMLMLNLVFDMEMLFGSSDWVTSLTWNSGGYVPISYLILLLASIVSLCFMLWLVITPLKSVSSGIDSGAMRWENEVAATELPVQRDETEDSELEYKLVKTVEEMEPLLMQEKILVSHQKGSYTGSETMFPETLSKPESNLQLSAIPETECETTSLMPSDGSPEASSDVLGMPLPESGMITKSETPDTTYSSSESKDISEKTLKIGRYVDIEKDEEGDSWEHEESVKNISESVQSVAPEGPESFRSLSGKTDDVGSGTGSLSRLAGLGRAARRQLTSILDEFWGQLFDFHGQVTLEAKAKKLDVLLGIDSKVDSKSSFVPIKMENNVVNPPGYFPSASGRGSDVLRMHHPVQGNAGSFLGVQKSSTMQSSYMQLLDAYVRSASYTAPDSGERRFHSVHVPSSSNGHDQQPATIHGYDMASYLNRTAKEKGYDYLKGQMEPSLTPQAVIKSNSQDLYSLPPGQKPQSALRNLKPPGFHNVPVSRNNSLRSERPVSDLVSSEAVNYTSHSVPDVKKFHSLPDISLYLNSSPSRNSPQWESPMGYGPQSIRRPMREQVSLNAAPSWASSTPSVFNELSPSKVCRDAFSLQFGSSPGASSLWSKQPFEQFGVADKSPSKTQENFDMEAKVLQSFRSCITKLLRLEGSDWLFRQNDGADEDLIDQVAERERFLYEAECRTVEKKLISPIKTDETNLSKLMAVPNCGDGCVWKIDLIVSFGVWCIHRILELSLMESRPELWGKYTYVLNRLQGIIDLAFSKPRSLMAPCFCLQLPAEYVQKAPPTSSGGLPPHSKPGRGKFTNTSMLLDIIKDVETAISCRKGRSGTAAGDVAFPKGKENLASVLKRYKRRLSIKPIETGHHGGMRKNAISSPLSS